MKGTIQKKESKDFFFFFFFFTSYLTFCFMLFRFKMFMRLKAFFFCFIYVFIEKNLQQFIYLLVWLAILCGLQDLSCLTRDEISVPWSGSIESWQLDHQGIPWVFILHGLLIFCYSFEGNMTEATGELRNQFGLPHHLIGKKCMSYELTISKPPGYWKTEIVSSVSHFCYWYRNMNRKDRSIIYFLYPVFQMC